jgi:hypothetical protein
MPARWAIAIASGTEPAASSSTLGSRRIAPGSCAVQRMAIRRPNASVPMIGPQIVSSTGNGKQSPPTHSRSVARTIGRGPSGVR